MDQDVPAASLVPPDPSGPPEREPRGGDLVRRHAWPVRLWHWINAVTLAVMLMSGLMIFNAHPRLYWGEYGANSDPAWLDLSQVNNGIPFPGWITIPSFYSLSDARLWHFAFAWCLSVAFTGYVGWALVRGHFRRNLVPERAELAPAHLLHDITEHAKLRFPTGKAALKYNILQKLAYGSVVFLLLPAVILTGLTMSPGLNAGLPFLLDLFGGRQSARSLHFLCTAGLAAFFFVHIAMVVLAGPVNETALDADRLVPAPPRTSGQTMKNAANPVISRRGLLSFGAATASGLLLGGCDRLNKSQGFRDVLDGATGLNMRTQRLLIGDSLAREFSPADLSPVFRANGNTAVADPAYRAHFAQGFANWALQVDGLVKQPLRLSLAALQAMPQRSQITRHDCVEGWSAIGKWQGPQLSAILAMAGLLPAARYVVFHCADILSGAPYYESIDLIDAFHPQTILAWRMNDAPLREAHGAPLRLRVERQLGYKHAKFVMRLELRETLRGVQGGKGGSWEDNSGYQWYAGI